MVHEYSMLCLVLDDESQILKDNVAMSNLFSKKRFIKSSMHFTYKTRLFSFIANHALPVVFSVDDDTVVLSAP